MCIIMTGQRNIFGQRLSNGRFVSTTTIMTSQESFRGCCRATHKITCNNFDLVPVLILPRLVGPSTSKDSNQYDVKGMGYRTELNL